jgi:hypothetical protein
VFEVKFLKDGLSLDEFKFSSLVIAFLCFAGVAVFGYITGGDISNNWLDLLETMIYVIGGVNAVKGLGGIASSAKNKRQLEDDINTSNDNNSDEYDRSV